MLDYNLQSDKCLIKHITEQDQVAFTVLYNRYWSKLFLHARHMLDDDDAAQDIVQEIFTWIWQHSQQIGHTESISGYLYKTTRNKVLDRIKHEKIKHLKLPVISENLKTTNYSLDDEIYSKELAAIIDSEILKMPEKMRTVFELSRQEHLTHKMIADQMGISEQTVRKHVQKALRILRTRLQVTLPVLLWIVYQVK